MKVKPISSRTNLSKILMGLFQNPEVLNEFVELLESISDTTIPKDNSTGIIFVENVMKKIYSNISQFISLIPTIEKFDFDDNYTKQLSASAKNKIYSNYEVDCLTCYFIYKAMYLINYKSTQSHTGPLINSLICNNCFSPEFNFRFFGQINDQELRVMFNDKFDTIFASKFIPSTISMDGKKDREVTAEGNREKLYDKFKLDTCNYNFNISSVYDFMIAQFLSEKIAEHLKRRFVKSEGHSMAAADNFNSIFTEQFITYSVATVITSAPESDTKSEIVESVEKGE